MARRSASHGMRIYLTLWVGNFVSGLGTGLGSFALCVWIYDQTKSATQFSTMMFLAAITGLIAMPIGGSIADRLDRRKVLIWANVGMGIMTLLIASALYTHTLRVWHSYVIAVVMNFIGNCSGPSFMAIVPLLVSRQQLTRMAGLMTVTGSVTGLAVPFVAGTLVQKIGFHNVVFIDFFTFLFAIGTLLIVRIPKPPVTLTGSERRSVIGDFIFGWKYLHARPGLFNLLMMFGLTNLSAGVVQVLLGPLILSFASPMELGSVNSASAAGVILGSIALSVWGGPKRRVWGIFFGLIIQACLLFLGGLKPNVPLVAFALCIATFTAPIINGCNAAIWSSKLAHDVQGRVLAARSVFGMIISPIAFLLAGPLSDRVFRPLLLPGGPLADSVGRIIGVGPGRGTGLLFITLGIFMIVVVCGAFLNPRLRNVESELPDVVRPTLGGDDQGPAAPATAPQAATA